MFLGIRMGICKYTNYWKRSSDDGSMMGSIPAASTVWKLVRFAKKRASFLFQKGFAQKQTGLIIPSSDLLL